MSLGTSIRTLRAELRRLEDQAGMGRRNCAYCRLKVRQRLSDPERPEPNAEEAFQAECEYCGSEFWVSLSHCSESYRDLIRLYFSFTIEDTFTDRKAYSLYLWAEPGRETLRGIECKEGAAPSSEKETCSKLRAELAAQHDRLERRKYRRLIAKYGEDPFPHLTRQAEEILHEAHVEHDPGLLPRGHMSRPKFEELEREERKQLVRAAMECVIFGQAIPETEEAVAGLRARIDELLEWPKVERRREAEREARRLAEEEQRLEAEARRREEAEARRRGQEEERRRREVERAETKRRLRAAFPPGVSNEFIERFIDGDPG